MTQQVGQQGAFPENLISLVSGNLKKVLFAIVLLALVGYLLSGIAKKQWDFKTYYYAGKTFEANLNPYNFNTLSGISGGRVRFDFTYPPITKPFFILLSYPGYKVSFWLFLITKLILTAGLLYLWQKKFLKGEVSYWFYLFCLVAFNKTIYIDIRAGNISILEECLLWGAFLFFLKNRLLLFCILINAAAFFKITPILFLFLLVFSKDKNRYAYLAGSLFFYASLWAGSYLGSVDLYNDFFRNIPSLSSEHGLFNPSTLALIKDLFSAIGPFLGSAAASRGSDIAYMVVVGIVLLISGRAYLVLMRKDGGEKETVTLFFSCLVYALILPRFKDYSYILLLLPAYYILARSRFKAGVYVSLFFIILLPLYPHMLNYSALIGAYCLWILYLKEIYSTGPGLQRNSHAI